MPRTPSRRRSFFVETDEGLTGIGSGDTMDGFERYVDLFVGGDPLDIEHHVRVLETITFHAGRYWPFEAALWDLAGKAAGSPVASSWRRAGRPRRLRVDGRPPRAAARAESALALREQGFRRAEGPDRPPATRDGLAAVAAVRDAVGPSMEIMVDLNQGWRMPGDVRPFSTPRQSTPWPRGSGTPDVCWLEEPLAGDDVAGLARLRAEAGLRLAGGEMARTPAELDAYLERRLSTSTSPTPCWRSGSPRPRVGRAGARARALVHAAYLDERHRPARQPPARRRGRRRPLPRVPADPPGWTPERRDFMLAEPVPPDAEGRLAVPAGPASASSWTRTLSSATR